MADFFRGCHAETCQAALTVRITIKDKRTGKMGVLWNTGVSAFERSALVLAACRRACCVWIRGYRGTHPFTHSPTNPLPPSPTKNEPQDGLPLHVDQFYEENGSEEDGIPQGALTVATREWAKARVCLLFFRFALYVYICVVKGWMEPIHTYTPWLLTSLHNQPHRGSP